MIRDGIFLHLDGGGAERLLLSFFMSMIKSWRKFVKMSKISSLYFVSVFLNSVFGSTDLFAYSFASISLS